MNILINTDCGRITVLVLSDLSAAFDTIGHDMLLKLTTVQMTLTSILQCHQVNMNPSKPKMNALNKSMDVPYFFPAEH